MSEFINTIDEIGGQALLERLISGTLITLKSTHIKKLGSNGLSYGAVLYIDLPNLVNWSDINVGSLKCSGYDFTFYGTTMSTSTNINASTIDTIRFPQITAISPSVINNYF